MASGIEIELPGGFRMIAGRDVDSTVLGRVISAAWEAAEEMVALARGDAARAQAEASEAQATLLSHEALVAHLKLMIEKLRRQL